MSLKLLIYGCDLQESENIWDKQTLNHLPERSFYCIYIAAQLMALGSLHSNI